MRTQVVLKLFAAAAVLAFHGRGLAAGESSVFELKKLQVHEREPAAVVKKADGHFFIDFGRDAFGWLELDIDSPAAREIEIHLGEKATDEQTVDRKPGGTIRHVATKLALKSGRHRYRVQTPPDKRNTTGDAIRVPDELGIILPFRYVEILGTPVDLDASNVRQHVVIYPFDDEASHFASSDAALDEIWDFCKYSIKATTAFGIYVDGDRERIPYEADAYINQLAHYGVDDEYALARHTHEYLLEHPTWPTEWKQHSVLMAHADWMYTGDTRSIERNYDLLKREKTLSAYAREDGLLDTGKLRDIVDWPAGERDGYVFAPINTVINAFHYRTLVLMAEMADAIGKTSDAQAFRREAQRVYEAFNEKLFDPQAGVYVDGAGVSHASLHANLFPLAFGLVPEARKPKVIEFIKSNGMACSVYPAQFLLEALYENGEAEYALSLITSDGKRSWRNMLRAGSTITMEAWDIEFKPNLDWNHAWGAAPANILPRYVLGVRPLAPGFTKMLIQPQLGSLERVEGKVPTIRGPVHVKVDAPARRMEIEIPPETSARVIVPWSPDESRDVGPGRHVFE